MRPVGVGLALHATVAAAASDRALVKGEPVVRSFLGYDFDLGPMLAGLLACLAVRFYVSATQPEHRKVDYPITTIALLFTAGVIIKMRPEPLTALGWGTGLGAFGVGIIKVALAFVQRNLGAFGEGNAPPKPPAA